MGNIILLGTQLGATPNDNTTPLTPVTKLAGDGDSQMGGAGYGSPAIIAADLMGKPYAYFSHSGFITMNIEPFIASEVIPAAPSHCVLSFGVNDVNGGRAHSETMFYSRSIFEQLIDANIVPIIILIPGWNNGSILQNQKIDAINAEWLTMATDYPTLKYLDDRAELCQFRTGGPAGNLYDLKPQYSADGIHLNVDANTNVRAPKLVTLLTT